MTDESSDETSELLKTSRERVQRILVRIFEDVLDVRNVSPEDGFFDIGGDSISALLVRAKAKEFGVQIELARLYEFQSAYELCRTLSLSEVSESYSETSPFSLISSGDKELLPDGVVDAYPCTQLQLAMIAAEPRGHETPVYINAQVWELTGVEHRKLLRRAITETVQRHPVLKTAIDLVNYSRPLQLVYKTVVPEIEEIDLRLIVPEDHARVLSEWIGGQWERGFKPAEVPLIRFVIAYDARARVHLGYVSQHAILDGWSVSLLYLEIVKRCEHLSRKQITETKIIGSFRDHVASELKVIASDAHREFWRNCVIQTRSMLPSNLILPCKANVLRIAPGHTAIQIGERLFLKFQDTARSTRVPLKSILLAAHLAALRELSGCDEVVTGVHTHLRPDTPGGLETLGLFLNVAPFNFCFKQETYRTLLSRVRDAEIELMPWWDYPLAMINRAQPGLALFETAFSFIHFRELSKSNATGPIATVRARSYLNLDIPILVQFVVSARSLEVLFIFDPKRFPDAYMDGVAECFQRVLDNLVLDIDKAVATSVQGPDERAHLVSQLQIPLKTSETTFSIGKTIETRAQSWSMNVAVISEQGDLNYSDLLSKARLLASALCSKEIQGTWTLGIIMERSPEAIIAFLAAQLCGISYVPIDQTLTPSRIGDMISNTSIKCIVFANSDFLGLTELGLHLIDYNTLDETVGHETSALNDDGESPVSILFTSQMCRISTGIVIGSRALSNQLDWLQSVIQLNNFDRVLNNSPICFDAAAWETYWPLLHGATIVTSRPMLEGDEAYFDYLVELIVTQQVTVATFPTRLLSHLLPHFSLHGCGKLRAVLVVGEALKPELADEAINILKCQLVGIHGATEGPLVTWTYVESSSTVTTVRRPVPGNEGYILNQHLQPVLHGVTGELYLAGRGLMNGYAGRAAETAARFLPNPFSIGERMYRTGDSVFLDNTGSISLVDRREERVEINGLLINLEEIDVALLAEPVIEDCAAAYYLNESGRESLILFVVWNGAPSHATIESHVSMNLPVELQPCIIQDVERIPITKSGKRDRRRLTASYLPHLSHVEPRTLMEKNVAIIWQDVLKVARVGLSDNIFDLGGNSLAAAKIALRCRRELGLDVRAFDILRLGDIGSLSKFDEISEDI